LNTLTEGGGSSEGARDPSKPKKSVEAGEAAGAEGAASLEGASKTISTDFMERPPSTCLPAGFLTVFASF
jgi:hypothetical protein